MQRDPRGHQREAAAVAAGLLAYCTILERQSLSGERAISEGKRYRRWPANHGSSGDDNSGGCGSSRQRGLDDGGGLCGYGGGSSSQLAADGDFASIQDSRHVLRSGFLSQRDETPDNQQK